MKTIKNEDQFEVLRKIDKETSTSQRKLAVDLGFSLGKLHYCLKELQKKVYKINNFNKKKKNKKFFNTSSHPKEFLKQN